MKIAARAHALTLGAAATAGLLLSCGGGQTPPPEQPAAPAAPPPSAATDPEAAAAAKESWRASAPAPGPQAELTLPVFSRAKLDNGLTVLATEIRALPVVSFVLITRGGSSTDLAGKEGITALAYALLDEGAGKRSALEFSDAVADLGAGFGTSADQDGGTASISGLSRNADAMVALLADAVLRPRLEQKDLDRIKGLTIADILQSRGSPSGLAFEFVPAMIYGESHPYGHPVTGVPATVEAITLKHVKDQLAKLLVPSASAFVAVGDINLEDATRLAKTHFGKWKGPRAALPKQPAVAPDARKKVEIVHKENSPQTMVVIGRPIFGKGSEDEVPLIVANNVYGGTFASRLNMNLRENKGYTYGARSMVSARSGVGAFLAYANIRQDVTAPGLAEFFTELSGMTGKPPEKIEVDRAKEGLIRSLPGQFERTGDVASAAGELFVYDLPLDRYARRPAEVAAVDAAAVARVSKLYFTPEAMKVLLVGDSAVISSDVGKLELGEVVTRHP